MYISIECGVKIRQVTHKTLMQISPDMTHSQYKIYSKINYHLWLLTLQIKLPYGINVSLNCTFPHLLYKTISK